MNVTVLTFLLSNRLSFIHSILPHHHRLAVCANGQNRVSALDRQKFLRIVENAIHSTKSEWKVNFEQMAS